MHQFLATFWQSPLFGIILWAAVFIFTLIIELANPQLVSIWFCGSSFIAFILALFGVPFWIQVIIFVLLSATLLGLSFAFFRKSFLNRTKLQTNISSLLEEEIELLTDANRHQPGSGIYRDVKWTLVVEDDQQFNKGEIALIKQIKGNRLIIKKK